MTKTKCCYSCGTPVPEPKGGLARSWYQQAKGVHCGRDECSKKKEDANE